MEHGKVAPGYLALVSTLDSQKYRIKQNRSKKGLMGMYKTSTISSGQSTVKSSENIKTFAGSLSPQAEKSVIFNEAIENQSDDTCNFEIQEKYLEKSIQTESCFTRCAEELQSQQTFLRKEVKNLRVNIIELNQTISELQKFYIDRNYGENFDECNDWKNYENLERGRNIESRAERMLSKQSDI